MNQADLDDLLAQLRSTQDHVLTEAVPPSVALPSSSYNSISSARTAPSAGISPPPKKDLSRLTFPESLPLLRQIAVNEPSTLAQLQTLQKEQHALERKWFLERNEWEAQGKRKGIKFGPDSAPGMVARMKLFDRALLQRWRKYQLSQQAKLVELGIPCFSVGTDGAKALVKMERVMNVIVGMLDDQQEADQEAQRQGGGDSSF
ncbi:BQ5605_C001g00056 [Microbotryum silenes-dioicae]|uniref:BQ5605_C001g00056 protein n=1 Tax=Microbotryum silenes-dioicae TaxID=796604 RepID=A0A2X0P559_9BASI|nr:BQ5605_C001g00056 [Microbotryum silenes-dioicae]